MPNKIHVVPIYQEHAGTIRVSAQTNPPNCAAKAIKCLENELAHNIDFLCMGEQATYQTMLAMSLFRIFQEENTSGELSLAFTPFHVHVVARDRHNPGQTVNLTATVWRTSILESEQVKRLLQLNSEPSAVSTLPPPKSP